ncbi:MAG: hypothetical protein K2H86_06660 [Muribaculaceae bacterium]|nr:hypothetical protein [Muribaculaceae bacterium]
MRYYTLDISNVIARVAHFDNNREEAYIILHHRDPRNTDIRRLLEDIGAATGVIAERLNMKPVFKRFLMSDVTNQSSLLPEHDDCARSVIQQPPLDGSKVVLMVIMQQHSSFKDNGDGVWVDDLGRIWIGDNENITSSYSLSMTMEYLETMSRDIAARGGRMADHCLRTWFYVRDVDNNYAGVVKGRNEVFAREGLTAETHYIASTGIAGQSADPSRIVAFNAFADTGLRPEQIRYLYGRSHLNPTYEYGVAFERGTAVDYGDRRHIYISGTASINNRGEIVAPGDIVAQTERMLENIGVLLAEGECAWDEVTNMIIYLRDMADYHTVERIVSQRFPDVPHVILLAPVCRPGWLIETECMAVKRIDRPEYAPF